MKEDDGWRGEVSEKRVMLWEGRTKKMMEGNRWSEKRVM